MTPFTTWLVIFIVVVAAIGLAFEWWARGG
jgi:hypothetical protein